MTDRSRRFVIASREFALQRSRVESGLRDVLPEPVRDHYVVINRRRYPPKQVVGVLTGLGRADFTSHHARRILAGLGFPLGRRARSDDEVGAPVNGDGAADPRRALADVTTRPSAETLEPFVGQWVATKGPEVLVAAEDPREVVGWLAEHRERADSMFRVPRDEFEASGAAPL